LKRRTTRSRKFAGVDHRSAGGRVGHLLVPVDKSLHVFTPTPT
jgi:hypothetical protein